MHQKSDWMPPLLLITISIYVLFEDPDIVYVAYKPPTASEESAEALKEVETLLQEIVMESLE